MEERIQPEPEPGTGDEHWRNMAADQVHKFWFTNREAGVLLAEIDRLRGRFNDLRHDYIAIRQELDEERAVRERIRQERDEERAVRERLSTLLNATALALKGPEPKLTKWSFHDLPELAANVKRQIDEFKRKNNL